MEQKNVITSNIVAANMVLSEIAGGKRNPKTKE
jgi:hypothetical protein